MDLSPFLFAGGGSGGHISPGLAIAERLLEQDKSAQVIFYCSDRPLDHQMLDAAGHMHHALPILPPGKTPTKLIHFLRSYRQSYRIAKERLVDDNIQHVVALGGFVSVPVVRAASSLKIPITLINLDQPPGRANRWIRRSCTRIWSACDLPDHPNFAERVVGKPIRRSTIATDDAPICRRALGLDPDRHTLLVTGASQGATSINNFMPIFAEREKELFASWQIYHLAGANASEIQSAYNQSGVPAKVDIFQEVMAHARGAADLAISRAGANSVAEAAANAVPTLFLPYPYHRDQHQRYNAQNMVEQGGAIIVQDHINPADNMTHLGPPLRELMENASKREMMRQQLQTNLPPDAAETIAKLLLAR